MVTHNRNGGSGAPHWWDDLPPQMRNRFTQPLAEPEEPQPPADTPAPVSGGEILGELSRLAVVFLLVALGNILFLFAALYFVYR
jgi:hypothetical protein